MKSSQTPPRNFGAAFPPGMAHIRWAGPLPSPCRDLQPDGNHPTWIWRFYMAFIWDDPLNMVVLYGFLMVLYIYICIYNIYHFPVI